MTKSGEVIAIVITSASFLAFFLPPAAKFDGYPRFQPIYNAFLIFIDWIALNKRIWYGNAVVSSASEVDTKKVDASIKRVTDTTDTVNTKPKE